MRFVFGYEEALGYTVGTVVRDKDGIGAALVASDWRRWCKAEGGTLLTTWSRCSAASGSSPARSTPSASPAARARRRWPQLMASFRARPPGAVGATQVQVVNDYQTRLRLEGGKSAPLTLPKANMLVYQLAGDARITRAPLGHRAEGEDVLRGEGAGGDG